MAANPATPPAPSERTLRTVPAYATWQWLQSKPAAEEKPRRFFFDECGVALAQRVPCMKPIGYASGTMPWLALALSSRWAGRSLDGFLRGASQVVIINNPLAGCLILLSLFFPSAIVGVHGVLGLAGATFGALVMGMDVHALQSGLFGYNGLLVGMGAATFLARPDDGWDPAVAVAAVVLGALSSLLNLALGNMLVPTFRSPPFTLAFNLTNILLVLSASRLARFKVAPFLQPQLAADVTALDVAGLPEGFGACLGWVLHSALTAVGQVFLCESALSGALILSGMFISSRIAAFGAYAGALVEVLLAMGLGVPLGQVAAGLWGYNGCLTAVAILTFFVPNATCCAMAVVAVFLTFMFDASLRAIASPLGCPIGTLPFCAAAFLFMLTHDKLPGFVAVPISDVSTPEDHLWSHRVGVVTMKDEAEAEGTPRRPCTQLTQQRRLSFGPDAAAVSIAAAACRDVETGGSMREPAREAIVLSAGPSRDPSVHGGGGLLGFGFGLDAGRAHGQRPDTSEQGAFMSIAAAARDLANKLSA